MNKIIWSNLLKPSFYIAPLLGAFLLTLTYVVFMSIVFGDTNFSKWEEYTMYGIWLFLQVSALFTPLYWGKTRYEEK